VLIQKATITHTTKSFHHCNKNDHWRNCNNGFATHRSFPVQCDVCNEKKFYLDVSM